MDDTICCPDCRTQLALPHVPAGQTVQCPRCTHVFEPAGTSASPTPQRGRLADGHDDDMPIPPTCMLRPQPLCEWKAMFAMVMLAVSLLSIGFPCYLSFEGNVLLRLEKRRPQMRREELAELDRRHVNLDQLWHKVPVVFITINAATIIAFLIWLAGASKNLATLQVGGRLNSPDAAVLSFLIPFVNLFRPYFIVQEIWRASNPHIDNNRQSWMAGRGSWMIRFWWFSCLGSISCWYLVYIRWMNFGQPVESWDWTLVPVCVAIAGVLLILIIRGITLRQRERFVRLYEDPE